MLQQSKQKLALAQSSQSTQCEQSTQSAQSTPSAQGTQPRQCTQTSQCTLTLTDRQAKLKSELNLSQQTPDCEAEVAEQLENLLLNFVDVFALDDSELGRTSLVQHTIDTSDHPPSSHVALLTFSVSQTQN